MTHTILLVVFNVVEMAVQGSMVLMLRILLNDLANRPALGDI